MLNNFRSLSRVLSSTLNLPGCFDHFVYEYELKNETITLPKEHFIFQKREKNGGLTYDLFEFPSADNILRYF